MTLGQKIRAARLEQRLTQEQLAGREVSKSYVSELERGHRTPRLATLKILARRLKRPVSFFLEGATEDQEPDAFLAVGRACLQAQSVVEAATWFRKALDAVSEDHDELLHARIELALAQVDERLGHDLRAWRRVERVLPRLARGEDRATLIRAQLSLGRAKLAAGDSSSAAWTFETALNLLPVPDADPSVASALYYYLGIARERLGETIEAAEAFRKAAEAAETFADFLSAGAWHSRRAVEAVEAGSYDTAVTRADEAVAVYGVLEHRRLLADIHWHLGDLEARADHWEDAHRHYVISVVLYGAARQASAAARTLGYFLDALRGRILPKTAQTIGEIVFALFPEGDSRAGTIDEDRAGTLWLRGMTERLLGRLDDARSSLTESLRLFDLLRRSVEVKSIRRELALVAVESNDLTAAREYLSTLQETAGAYLVTPAL